MAETSQYVGGDTRLFRPPAGWLLVAALSLLALLGLFDALRPGQASVSDRWVHAGFAIVFAAAALMQGLQAIRVDAVGVRSSDRFGRRRRVAWSQVHHFETRGYWRGLGLWTVDGRWIPMLQYGFYERRAAEVVVDLEAFRWARQQQLGLA